MPAIWSRSQATIKSNLYELLAPCEKLQICETRLIVYLNTQLIMSATSPSKWGFAKAQSKRESNKVLISNPISGDQDGGGGSGGSEVISRPRSISKSEQKRLMEICRVRSIESKRIYLNILGNRKAIWKPQDTTASKTPILCATLSIVLSI